MKKIILLIILIITTPGCSLRTKESGLTNNQRQEIQKLNEKIEIMAGQLASSSEQIKKIDTKQKDTSKKIVVERPTYVEKKTIIKDTDIKEQSNNNNVTTISASELAPYLTGVGRLDCSSDWSSNDWEKISTGSGSLWNIEGVGYAVLTNKHVVEKKNGPYSYCMFQIADNGNTMAYKDRKEIAPGLFTGGRWWLDENNIYTWNDKTDVALLKIKYEFVDGAPPDGLNYSIGALKKCDKRMPLNSPVVAIGFPASTMKRTIDGIYAYRTVTNGVISAHDESAMTEDGLQAPNYFVSAKIDSGNSGGIALSKDSNGLCVLGLPTWVNVGNFETAGVVQNIHNVFYKVN